MCFDQSIGYRTANQFIQPIWEIECKRARNRTGVIYLSTDSKTPECKYLDWSTLHSWSKICVYSPTNTKNKKMKITPKRYIIILFALFSIRLCSTLPNSISKQPPDSLFAQYYVSETYPDKMIIVRTSYTMLGKSERTSRKSPRLCTSHIHNTGVLSSAPNK